MSYYITAHYNGKHYRQMHYMYYSKREAVKLYREKFGLVGKHITLNISGSY